MQNSRGETMKYKRTLITTFALIIASFFFITADMPVQATTPEENKKYDIHQGDPDCEHSFRMEILLEATCSYSGEKLYTCEKCGGYEAEFYNNWDAHNLVADVPSETTCAASGRSHCTRCYKIFQDGVESTSLQHNYTTTIEKATPKKNGSVTVQCTACGWKNEEESYTIYKPKKIVLTETTAKYVYTGKAQKFLEEVKDSKGNVIESKNYKVSYKNNKNVGGATTTVTFKGKYYSGTLKKSCTIHPQKPRFFSQKEVGLNSITFSWKKAVKQTSGYQLQYSKKNFKSAKTIWVKNPKATQVKIKNLAEGTSYYIRVRSYKDVKINGKSKRLYSRWLDSKKKITTQKYPTLNIHPTTSVKVGDYELYKMYLDERGYPYYYIYYFDYGNLTIDQSYVEKANLCSKEVFRYMREVIAIEKPKNNRVAIMWEDAGMYNGQKISKCVVLLHNGTISWTADGTE